MNIRRVGFFDEPPENGIFVQVESNQEKMVFMKEGVRIEFNLNLVRSVIDNFDKALYKKDVQ